jgi:hypothetical protein
MNGHPASVSLCVDARHQIGWTTTRCARDDQNNPDPAPRHFQTDENEREQNYPRKYAKKCIIGANVDIEQFHIDCYPLPSAIRIICGNQPKSLILIKIGTAGANDKASAEAICST